MEKPSEEEVLVLLRLNGEKTGSVKIFASVKDWTCHASYKEGGGFCEATPEFLLYTKGPFIGVSACCAGCLVKYASGWRVL